MASGPFLVSGSRSFSVREGVGRGGIPASGPRSSSGVGLEGTPFRSWTEYPSQTRTDHPFLSPTLCFPLPSLSTPLSYPPKPIPRQYPLPLPFFLLPTPLPPLLPSPHQTAHATDRICRLGNMPLAVTQEVFLFLERFQSFRKMKISFFPQKRFRRQNSEKGKLIIPVDIFLLLINYHIEFSCQILATSECQYWQNSPGICQKITRKLD